MPVFRSLLKLNKKKSFEAIAELKRREDKGERESRLREIQQREIDRDSIRAAVEKELKDVRRHLTT